MCAAFFLLLLLRVRAACAAVSFSPRLRPGCHPTTTLAPRPLPPAPQLDVGETGIDYAEVAKREHLSELEVEMRRLNDKLKDLGKEQLYQRERELAFRATSESTAARVKWWSLFQTAVMLAAGLWQIYHLRTFLKSKKIN